MSGLTLDTGALIALDRNDRAAWAFLRRSVDRDEVPVVPTVVVAQAWRGSRREALLARALNACQSEVLDDELARRAGALCGRAGTADIVDAVVVESAAGRHDIIVTSDPNDLRHLAGHATGAVTVVPV